MRDVNKAKWYDRNVHHKLLYENDEDKTGIYQYIKRERPSYIKTRADIINDAEGNKENNIIRM